MNKMKAAMEQLIIRNEELISRGEDAEVLTFEHLHEAFKSEHPSRTSKLKEHILKKYIK